MLAPTLKHVSLKLIRPTAHNPARRATGSHIRQLANSIRRVGLQYPILIGKDHTIIDGNRRFFAHKMLGYPTIPALVSSAEPNQAYAEINTNACRLTGNDQLAVYLKNPDAVSKRARRTFENMESRLGRPMIELIQKHGFSMRIYSYAVAICRACDRDTDEWVKKTVGWFITCESLRYVQSLLAAKVVSPALILRHVQKKRPLKIKIG